MDATTDYEIWSSPLHNIDNEPYIYHWNDYFFVSYDFSSIPKDKLFHNFALVIHLCRKFKNTKPELIRIFPHCFDTVVTTTTASLFVIAMNIIQEYKLIICCTMLC